MTASATPEPSPEPATGDESAAALDPAAVGEPPAGDDTRTSWLARLMRPAPLVAASTALSFSAWAIANFLEDDAVDFSATPTWGTLVYLCWIAAAIAAAHVGYSIIRPKPRNESEAPVPVERPLHIGLLVTAGAGISYIVWIWYRDGLDVIGLIKDNQANLLRYAIPYSAGPATLRYAAIPAAALAMRNIFVFRWHRHPSRLRAVDLLSLVALAIVAVPSSRLSVLMALVTAAALLCYVDNRVPSLKQVLVVVVVTAAALAALNFSRNGGYYRERGVSDPASMLLYQSVSYVGAAFEGGSVTGNVLLGRTDASPVLGLGRAFDPWMPTFLPWHDGRPPGAISIHEISTIERSLTTNSVFAETTLKYGIASMLAILVLIFAAAVIVGLLLRQRSLVSVLAAGPLLYAFAEVWRVPLFNDGLMIFCVVSPLALYALITLWDRRRPLSAPPASDDGTPPTRTSAPTAGEPTTVPDH